MSRSVSPLRDRMIFVVGARRSGTNWLQRLLCARPDVAAVPSETYLFSHGIAPLVERFHHAAPSSPTTGSIFVEREAMLDSLRDLCDSIFAGVLEAVAPRASRLVERTPDHVRHLGLIADIYPDAHLVHIIRDGRDVARSLLSQDWGPDSLENAAEEWRSAITAARSVAPNLPLYREVRYEELFAAPRSQLAHLLGWLSLDASPEVVETALIESGIHFNVDEAAPQVATGKWRASFSRDDVERFNRIAGDVLAKLGYPDAAPGPSPGSPSPRPVRRPTALVSGLRRRMTGSGSTAVAVDREIRSRATAGQEVLDRALSALAARRFDELAGLLTPDAHIRVVGPDGRWEGRGKEGLQRLIAYLRSDGALEGRVVRGDVYPSVPTLTAITTYRLTDGTAQDRMLTATVAGSSITRLAYYRLPLGGS